MILAHLATIMGILVSLVPLIFTMAKVFPKIFSVLRALFGASRGYVGKSGAAGVFLAILSFLGGVGAIVFLYHNFSLKLYMGWVDFVLTPFAYVLKGLLTLVVSGLPPGIPQGFLAVVGILDLATIVSLFIFGWCTEFYMRLVINFIARKR